MRTLWLLTGFVALSGCPKPDTESDQDTDTEPDSDTDTCPASPGLPVVEFLPDIVPLPATDVAITDRYVTASDCAWADRCVDGLGHRTLLSFGTRAANQGVGDFIIGLPSEAAGVFEHSLCHDDDHFLEFATYRLIDDNGDIIRDGHRQPFCLTDVAPIDSDDPDTPPLRTYSCDNQGITRGWYDEYAAGMVCQWVDVTGVQPGEYQLEIELNETGLIRESDLTNNVIRTPVTIAPLGIDRVCYPSDGVAAGRDCGWHTPTSSTCTPGEQVAVGCGTTTACEGTCGGDPMVRVCEGVDQQCTRNADVLSRDNSCGNPCPNLEVTCPPTGTLTVWVGGEPGATCDVVTAEVGAIDPLADCLGPGAGDLRECGWDLSLGAACIPGEALWVGCDAAGCGLPTCPDPSAGLEDATCDGAGVLRVCPGSEACVKSEAIGKSDGVCGGDCPASVVTCPDDAHIQLMTGALIHGNTYDCEPVVLPTTHTHR